MAGEVKWGSPPLITGLAGALTGIGKDISCIQPLDGIVKKQLAAIDDTESRPSAVNWASLLCDLFSSLGFHEVWVN